jgi:DNA mismatch repair ATPase MutL
MMEDLSFHVLDLAENAVNAGATRIIILINENAAHDVLTIRVADNGRGMPADTAGGRGWRPVSAVATSTASP